MKEANGVETIWRNDSRVNDDHDVVRGASAANQVLDNIQGLYLDQLTRPDTATTLILLVILSILLSALSMWPQNPLWNHRNSSKSSDGTANNRILPPFHSAHFSRKENGF